MKALLALSLAVLASVLLLQRSEAVEFAVPPPAWSGEALTEEEEIKQIQQSALVESDPLRVRRLFWHWTRVSQRPDSPLYHFVLEQFLGPRRNEFWLGTEIRAIAQFLVADINLRRLQSLAGSTEGIPEEIALALAGKDATAVFNVQRAQLDKMMAGTGYEDAGQMRNILFEILSELRWLPDVALRLRLSAPVLFFDCMPIGLDTGDKTPAVLAVEAVTTGLAIAELPKFDRAMAERSPGYTFAAELREWWIKHATDYGAEQPPQSVIDATRKFEAAAAQAAEPRPRIDPAPVVKTNPKAALYAKQLLIGGGALALVALIIFISAKLHKA